MTLQEIVEASVHGAMKALGMAKRALGSAFENMLGVEHLAPEITQLDAYRFEATIKAGVVTQPATVKVPAGYYFAVLGVQGYIDSPGIGVFDFGLVTFNMNQNGKRNVWGTDQSMAQYLDIIGLNNIAWFPDTLYRFDSGGDIQLKMTCASGWDAAADGANGRKVGIVLYGKLVASSAAKAFSPDNREAR